MRWFHLAAMCSWQALGGQVIYNDFADRDAFTCLGLEAQSVPLVLNAPHSGRDYPARFLEQSLLDATAIRASEDMDVDILFNGAVGLGCVLQAACFPRAYLDVNREPYELDPGMFHGDLPPHANVRSLRVTGGLGTIAKIVAENRLIYRGKLDPADALNRIDTLYRPYHNQLRHCLADTHERFGQAVLLDCHSMPSDTRPMGAAQSDERPDIILGDRYGTSCRHDLVNYAVELLRGEGLTVAKNRPYAGGFITEHYGRPKRGLHALQIEINRGLYMNEVDMTRSRYFEDLQDILTRFCRDWILHPAFQAQIETAWANAAE